MMKSRFFYALAALALLAAELCIAMFIRNPFVRGSLGDVLVVILIHCALRVLLPHKPRLLPLYVFLLACLVEFTQYVHLLDIMGLGHIAWLRVLMGATFSWGDILCYAVGCALIAAAEHLGQDRENGIRWGEP